MIGQKKELDEVIARHLSFIDALLKDKEDLTTKTDTLTKQLERVEKKWEEEVRSMN